MGHLALLPASNASISGLAAPPGTSAGVIPGPGKPGTLPDCRQKLASYMGADPENLVYIPNATFGVNLIARSLDFKPGDELLTSNHKYGALIISGLS